MAMFLPHMKTNGVNAEMYDRDYHVINTHEIVCPRCRQDSRLKHVATVECSVDEEGVLDNIESPEAQDMGSLHCGQCGWSGTWAEGSSAFMYGVPKFMERIDWGTFARMEKAARAADNEDLVVLLEHIYSFCVEAIEDTTDYNTVMDDDEDDSDPEPVILDARAERMPWE